MEEMNGLGFKVGVCGKGQDPSSDWGDEAAVIGCGNDL